MTMNSEIEFELDNFFQKNINLKKEFIEEKAKKITVPSHIDQDLKSSYQYKEVINKFIIQYFSKKNENNKNKKNDYTECIKKKIIKFKENYINNILPIKINFNATNLYEMSAAKTFSKTNTITRSLSTVMGHLWEDLATCSNEALSTEKEFNLKIKGVDLIIIEDNKPFYCQIKTLEGTLTGSQSNRSNIELGIHQNAYFVSAFKTGTGWTFNSNTIKRLVGSEFWEKIEIDYDTLLGEVKKMIYDVEQEFLKLNKS